MHFLKQEVTVNIENVDTNEEEIIQRNTNKHTEFIIKKTIEGYIELVAGINYNTVRLVGVT